MPQKTDAVNPSHYAGHTVFPYQLIREYNLNFLCGNVVKYVTRHQEKNGREDLCKALWNLCYELGMPLERVVALTKAVEGEEWKAIKVRLSK